MIVLLMLAVVTVAIARPVVSGVLVTIAVVVTTASAAAATWAVTVAHCDAPKRVFEIGGLRWSDLLLR